MAYGRRKKGGQRLMEMSRAGAKRKATRKAKTLAQAKANIAKGPVTRGGAKRKVAPKSTVGGRNKTALGTPKSAGNVAGRTAINFGVGAKNTRGSTKKPTSTKQKPTTTTKQKPTRTTTKQKTTAAGRNRTALRTPRGAGSVAKPAAKRKSSGPAPLPKTMVGRQSFGETLKEKGPGTALDAALIASLLLTRGRGPAGAKGKGALSRTMTRLKDVFKPTKPKKPSADPYSVPGGRGSGYGGGKPPAASKPKPKPKKKTKPKPKPKPESAFKNTPETKTQRRYPGGR